MDVGGSGIEYTVRDAVHDDLDTIAGLTRQRRDALAAWSPRWWAKAASADELHPLWLAHLVGGGAARVVIVEADGAQVGCAVVLDQGSQFFVDDVSISPGHAAGAIGALIDGTRGLTPALTCVPTTDEASIAGFVAANAELVSAYWIIDTNAGAVDAGRFVGPDATPRPRHTFGGRPFDPAAPGALAFTNESGTVVGTRSVAAPPVYDPGGTVTVADLVVGSDLYATLETARSVAGQRGDVLLAVVCDVDDHELAGALDETGFVRTVEIYALPT